ncbi:hypothetical protein [Nocardia sp. CNY236]|uniref:hypothetical protein n=1 Tax=Nocardia sp. CNY236 TaxID=1169152 RepID=UPI000417B800|nr:hypothetical protein [Nocardia sp. CNY236]
MSLHEPFHDPVELLDELDSIVRAQELLRQRVSALLACYRALGPHAEAGLFDRLDEYGWRDVFGSLNVEATVDRLGAAVDYMRYSVEWLAAARGLAVQIREYPRPEPEQAACDEGGGRSL